MLTAFNLQMRNDFDYSWPRESPNFKVQQGAMCLYGLNPNYANLKSTMELNQQKDKSFGAKALLPF